MVKIVFSIAPEVKYNFPKNHTLDNYLMYVYGRLRRGKLDGFVVVNGILSNDPASGCNFVATDGLGFVGNHFKAFSFKFILI